ncbi:MarR family winged helix-turn-helix transcriptional regulator [Arthrobacter bambusae]|uniref:MarR family winged helix-turn-helix transcriptional regulator n=1 Tax=Arthrobacter bambusae TaxID=1338426 RepID=UPI00277EB0D9|nr:MarR family transcriptional regulator [Arthrobacter bambusae]MDQ0028464.1 DNA-binding MarR family transcriptional regulator [Arthrobacter bambusae]MDQ0096741.1 DNA-binding MarR family transcriptional regulator [Arthrobacter bambusae]
MPDLNDWTTPRLLSTAARLVEHAWNEELAVLGLTHAGVIALEVLDAEGSMVQARLSAKVRVQAQTMGQTLSRLEAHGHISRERSHHDGRSQRVAVSESGRTALVKARALDRKLPPRDEIGAEELRDKLVVVIRWLGSARWGEEAPESVPTARVKNLPEQG